MKRNKLYIFPAFIILISFLFACNSKQEKKAENNDANAALEKLMDDYYRERMELAPLESTSNGDTLYNDKLYPFFTDSYQKKLHDFFQKTADRLKSIPRDQLNENNMISYDFLNEYNAMDLEDIKYPFNLIPAEQFFGLHLAMGQFATGASAQPFNTVKDYHNWLSRIDGFGIWIDSAIVYYRRGMEKGIVLPKSLVVKMIPQFRSLTTGKAEDHLYFEPIKNFPASFTTEEKNDLTKLYTAAISDKVIPMHKKMADFLEKEYLPKARTTSGYGSLPQGIDYYKLMVRRSTTTNKTPEEIYHLGLDEVKRIRGEMDSVRKSIGFKGDLNQFFIYLRTDPAMFPFKTADEVLNATRDIQKRVDANLNNEFSITPKTPFEIRRVEAFREKTASASYSASPDNKKPAIYYVPVPDAKAYNKTGGMESTFLHEAIPGHHYQISIQRENDKLPMIRRYDPWSNAYVEGWALYTESLGKEMGLYTDPYQYMGALGDEIHRAIRLVLDVGIHYKGMTREEAIKYMMDNEQVTLPGAIAEVERYMAIPGQALGYKIGAIKIRELRTRYQKMLGDKFDVRAFHTEILKDGSMPLTSLEMKMDRWAKSVSGK